MLLFVLAFWLDLEWVTVRFPQTSRGGMAYYEHLEGTPYTKGPGPNTGLRITIARRLSPRLMVGAAATGIWGHLGYDDAADRRANAYTGQAGVVARWIGFERIVDGLHSSGAVRGELGVAGVHARADGMEVDSARRKYATVALELRVGGPKVKFIGSLGTTQPLGRTSRVVADEVVPQLPLGGVEMIIGVSIER